MVHWLLEDSAICQEHPNNRSLLSLCSSSEFTKLKRERLEILSGMGGKALHIDLSLIQFNTSSSSSHPPSSSSSSSLTFPVSVNEREPQRQICSVSCSCCRSGTCKKLEDSHRKGDKRLSGSLSSSIFGSVPSQSEVESAVAALQAFINGIYSSGPVQQLLESGDVRTLMSQGYGRVRDAFLSLQTDPSVKRLVVSLSSDRAVWNAVINNEMVKKLRDPSNATENCSSDDEPDVAVRLLWWIMDVAKDKVTELILKFLSLMNEVLQPREKETPAGEASREELNDKVRSSLLLSILILLIVIVARAKTA